MLVAHIRYADISEQRCCLLKAEWMLAQSQAAITSKATGSSMKRYSLK